MRQEWQHPSLWETFNTLTIKIFPFVFLNCNRNKVNKRQIHDSVKEFSLMCRGLHGMEYAQWVLTCSSGLTWKRSMPDTPVQMKSRRNLYWCVVAVSITWNTFISINESCIKLFLEHSSVSTKLRNLLQCITTVVLLLCSNMTKESLLMCDASVARNPSL